MMKPSDIGKLPPAVKWIIDRCRIEDDCYVWKQAVSSRGGRPVARLNKKQICPQRVVYSIMTGKDIDNVPGRKLKVLLKCGDNRCCNWEHMRIVTHKTVMREAAAAGRFKSGLLGTVTYTRSNRQKPHVKLDVDKVRAMRQAVADGRSIVSVANEYGLRYQHAWSVIRGKLWKDLSPFGLTGTI